MYHIHIYIYTYIHVCHVYVVTVATTVREITTCRREKKFVRMVHVINYYIHNVTVYINIICAHIILRVYLLTSRVFFKSLN